MKRRKYTSIAALLFAASLLFAGCGKLGESEAVDIVRENCKFPESFKKIAYEIDENAGLSYLDFKAKNTMGEEISDRVYFIITADYIKAIDTSSMSPEVLMEFQKNDPKNFEYNVNAYKAVDKAQNNGKLEMKVFLAQYHDLEGEQNYFAWRSVANDTYLINKYIKDYKEAYDQAPPIVQKYFEKPMNYFKIDVVGDYWNWDSHVERPAEYPDMENFVPKP